MKSICRLISITLLATSAPAFAADQGELSKKLNNPVAALITLPIEYNKDTNIGPNRTGEVTSVKFSPVVPFDISENWNLISRTIFSYVDQDIPDFGFDETGISDIAQTVFFSPKAPTESGWIWGAGVLLLLDSATEDSLGAGKWGVGPSAVALKQTGPWTFGALGHYLTDFAGDDDRADVEQLFLQPFLSYNFGPKTGATLQAEITRDLDSDETGAFVLFQVNRMFNIGSQIMQGRIGVRHWFERLGYGADSTELNLRLTLLFPRK